MALTFMSPDPFTPLARMIKVIRLAVSAFLQIARGIVDGFPFCITFYADQNEARSSLSRVWDSIDVISKTLFFMFIRHSEGAVIVVVVVRS